MSVLLEIDRLNVDIIGQQGHKNVVSGISAVIHRGETLAIVGESGSGKSVSSLSLMQLLPNQKVIVEGKAVLHTDEGEVNLIEDPAEKFRGRLVAMVFQEPMAALNPVMSCGEQVEEMILQHQTLDREKVKQKVLQWFEWVELPDPEKAYQSYPFQLSGGQQQRVVIAMALVNQPLLLIADEPTTALDPEVQHEIIELLKKKQQEQGFGMLFISHDLDAVREIADHIMVMQQGQVVEQGPAAEILKRPKHPYTQALLLCKPSADKKGSYLPTVADVLKQTFKNQALKKNIGTEPLLSAEHISLSYTKKRWLKGLKTYPILKDVSFELFPGETVGLIGPSGCGKTSLGRIVSGWIAPTEGRVLFRGEEEIKAGEKKASSDWARKVQLIFQDPFGSLHPSMRIGECIMEPILVHRLASSRKEAKEKVLALLSRVGLGAEAFDRYPHEFSGGQRQRIVIARALAVEPAVLVCDESVAALDVSVQAQVLNLLSELQQDLGLSYLFISHDHQVIHYFCDRILQMNAGVLVRDDVPKPMDDSREERTDQSSDAAMMEPSPENALESEVAEEAIASENLQPEGLYAETAKTEDEVLEGTDAVLIGAEDEQEPLLADRSNMLDAGEDAAIYEAHGVAEWMIQEISENPVVEKTPGIEVDEAMAGQNHLDVTPHSSIPDSSTEQDEALAGADIDPMLVEAHALENEPAVDYIDVEPLENDIALPPSSLIEYPDSRVDNEEPSERTSEVSIDYKQVYHGESEWRPMEAGDIEVIITLAQRLRNKTSHLSDVSENALSEASAEPVEEPISNLPREKTSYRSLTDFIRSNSK
ncbi:MAG TPA: ABC transporter ATP-binding protein [Luteibaculaceae bacterium]|nr:ABC transporter ATP-binding protein [Luteibaculaceae bacterium]